MRDLINRIEKVLIRLVTLTLLSLIVIQGLMTSDPIRFYLSWGERMEGQTIEIPAASPNQEAPADDTVKSPQAQVTITTEKFSSLPKARLLVNGNEQGRFTQKEITLPLQAGDTLEIDSRAYNFPISFAIREVSANTEFPSPGQIYTANQTIVMVGKIIVK